MDNRRQELLTDIALIALALVLARGSVFSPIWAPFFVHESSEAFMQFTYYLKALSTGESLLWDHYMNLGTPGVPQVPLFSPVTWVLVAVAKLFSLQSMESLATWYALVSYALHITAGITAYLFARKIGLKRAGAIVTAIAYTYNFFTSYFGMYQGIYRLSALALMPLIFLQAWNVFHAERLRLAGLTWLACVVGLCSMSNGDVKPTMHFFVLLVFLITAIGWQRFGWKKAVPAVVYVVGLSTSLAAIHYALSYEIFREGTRAVWTMLRSPNPLHPDNTILGFSQNPVSLLLGGMFPSSFFNAFAKDPLIGVSGDNFGEARFSWSLPFLAFALLGLRHRLRHHTLWIIALVYYFLFLMAARTPFWPLFGEISKLLRVRYCTRTSIVIYFIMALYVGRGVDWLSEQTGKQNRRLNSLLVGLGGFALLALGLAYGNFPKLTANSELVFSVATLLLLTAPAALARPRLLSPLLIIYGVLFVAAFSPHGLEPKVRDALQREACFFALGLLFLIATIFVAQSTKFPRWGVFVLLAVCCFHFIKTQQFGIRRSAQLKQDTGLLFQTDTELAPIKQFPDYKNYRVYIASDLKEKLSPQLNFRKAVHNYCCSQYNDEMRFAFGLDSGPLINELAFRVAREDYSHPLWRLFNVRFIADIFDKYPQRLPKNKSLYRQITPRLIELTGPKPIIYYGSDPAFPTITKFHSGLLEANVELAQPDLVIFAEVIASSWRGFIDGAETRVFPVSGLMQAMKVPRGKHAVKFIYDPFNSDRVKLGLWLSVMAWGWSAALFLTTHGFRFLSSIRRALTSRSRRLRPYKLPS